MRCRESTGACTVLQMWKGEAMTPWIMPYHVEETASGLLVATQQPTYGVSPLKAAYSEWWKMQEIKKAIGAHAESMAVAEKPKKTYFGVDAAEGIDWSQYAFIPSTFQTWFDACAKMPLSSLFTSDRVGLATEYPDLRDEFERKLAETPLARWEAEVGEP